MSALSAGYQGLGNPSSECPQLPLASSGGDFKVYHPSHLPEVLFAIWSWASIPNECIIKKHTFLQTQIVYIWNTSCLGKKIHEIKSLVFTKQNTSIFFWNGVLVFEARTIFIYRKIKIIENLNPTKYFLDYSGSDGQIKKKKTKSNSLQWFPSFHAQKSSDQSNSAFASPTKTKTQIRGHRQWCNRRDIIVPIPFPLELCGPQPIWP